MNTELASAPAIPSINELVTNPARLTELPAEQRRRLVARLAAMILVLESGEDAPAPPPAAERPEQHDDRLLTVEEAAKHMGFAKSYVYEMIRRGDLQAVRRGKYVRVRQSAIDDWITRHET